MAHIQPASWIMRSWNFLQVVTYSGKGLSSAYVSKEVTDRAVLDGVSQGLYQPSIFCTWDAEHQQKMEMRDSEWYIDWNTWGTCHSWGTSCKRNGNSHVMLPGTLLLSRNLHCHYKGYTFQFVLKVYKYIIKVYNVMTKLVKIFSRLLEVRWSEEFATWAGKINGLDSHSCM